MSTGQHVVMWSGGITSWATARHVIAEHGTSNVTLLFADTNAEDEDLHRWNEEAAAQLGMNLVRVADPHERDPWQVFEDKRWLGNTRIAQCSHVLKQEPCRDWLMQNTDPADAVLAVLPTTDRAAVLREAADRLEERNPDRSADFSDGVDWTLDELRRMADEAQPNVEPSEADALWDELHRRDIETDKPHADEAQPAPRAHACRNCEGVDPDTCPMNPDRPKLPPMDPVHILGIDAPAVVAEQPAAADTDEEQPAGPATGDEARP
ncbi:hypothetical protein AB0L04_00690 [Streptomyces glaucescens]|uniref:hypothetical protein n=1 Tax=Streptomyces glaucescens TaxID=1907 RepID=UPI00344B2642